jgi:capsid protein
MGLLSRFKSLFRRSGRTVEITSGRDIHARYDAAQSSGMNYQHWGAGADALDADSANSKAVRQKLSQRARYETENNGYGKGITLTQANYVVGRGPKLRMQTKSAGFNAMVEAAWNRWAKKVKLARKLRTAIKAKVRDGEAFLVAKVNPGLADPVKLDLSAVECEQVTTPYLPPGAENQVDGIDFDAMGNRIAYKILKQHPGAAAWIYPDTEAETVPAKFVCHLFREDRAGQNRAVPELTPSLNMFPVARRWREATVVSAENIANISLFLKTQGPSNTDPDVVRPFSTLPIDKGMMVALPYGHEAFQPKPEQPSANYDMLNRATLCEEARPLNMPYNIAACDSSDYSFSGGRLDHLTYFQSVDVEQSELEDEILEPVFALWFAEAVLVYGWAVPTDPAPAHSWNWPARPQIDDQKTASARQTDLATGVRSLRRIYEEDGYDFDDELKAMADDYGKTVDEMRAILLQVNLLAKASSFAQPGGSDASDDKDPPPRQVARQAARNGTNGNGKARMPA